MPAWCTFGALGGDSERVVLLCRPIVKINHMPDHNDSVLYYQHYEERNACTSEG